MRLDKFLKVSRLIKRRTLAKEVADQGRISINGNQAKAASVVKQAMSSKSFWSKSCNG